jgi:HD-GYP domain-containing protein (c-di-GMP phosphodiesterase class II)
MEEHIMIASKLFEHRLSTLPINQRIPFLLEGLRNHDFGTYIHSINTAIAFLRFVRHLDVCPAVSNSLVNSVLLHDIGKIYIAPSILMKQAELTTGEWTELKRHPEYGDFLINNFLEGINVDSSLALLHHENIDGSGYPFQYGSGQLSLFCRMLRIVDSYDAMASERPYAKALTKEEAFQELKTFSGVYYDPQLVDSYINMVSREAGF